MFHFPGVGSSKHPVILIGTVRDVQEATCSVLILLKSFVEVE
jgi:hypothetical protein